MPRALELFGMGHSEVMSARRTNCSPVGAFHTGIVRFEGSCTYAMSVWSERRVRMPDGSSTYMTVHDGWKARTGGGSFMI